MIAKLLDEVALDIPKELVGLIKLLGATFQPEEYSRILSAGLRDSPSFETRRPLLELGHFSGLDFLQLLHVSLGEERTSVHVVIPFLNRLFEWGLVLDLRVFGHGSLFGYQWNVPRIAQFAGLNILDNVLLGPSYLTKKYIRSVPAIMGTKQRDEFTATAFLATSGTKSQKQVLVTAKHNVSRDEGLSDLRIISPDDVSYEPICDNWIPHGKLDLALIPVRVRGAAFPIFPLGTPSVLSRSLTLGYPRVGRSDAPYLLAHSGEVNANIRTFDREERIIISNLVAPGSSGGPVLDEAGLCIGLVVNALEVRHEGGTEKASAAIPSSDVLEFIEPFCD